jgi:FMN phosphatase YigB (HAD superfamily)
MKTKVFIDLDDTLFDTKSLKAENFRLFNDLPGNSGKLSRIEFDNLVTAGYKSRPDGVFTPSAMIKLLCDKGYNTDGLAEKREQMMRGAKRFFKPEIYDWIVANFPKEKYKYIIYSYGDPDFQHQKFKACDIESDFDQVIYLQGDKADALQQYLSQDEEFVLIDDKKIILEKVRSLHLRADLYHVNGTEVKVFK